MLIIAHYFWKTSWKIILVLYAG